MDQRLGVGQNVILQQLVQLVEGAGLYQLVDDQLVDEVLARR